MKESISALLDGQLSPSEMDRFLAEFERDPELRRHLSRQVLAREARQGTRVREPDLDFSDRVLAALDASESPVVVPFGDRVRRLPWRMAVSLAAAAGLGALSVLAVRPAAEPVLGSGPLLAASVPAATPAVAQAQPVETGYAELDDENAAQLRNYLMTYSQSRGQQGVGSTLGYARYAAYTDDRPAPAARPADLKR